METGNDLYTPSATYRRLNIFLCDDVFSLTPFLSNLFLDGTDSKFLMSSKKIKVIRFDGPIPSPFFFFRITLRRYFPFWFNLKFHF